MHKNLNKYAARNDSKMAELQAKIASQVGGKQEFEAMADDPRNVKAVREFCHYEFVRYLEVMSDNQVTEMARAMNDAEREPNKGPRSAKMAHAFGLFIRAIV